MARSLTVFLLFFIGFFVHAQSSFQYAEDLYVNGRYEKALKEVNDYLDEDPSPEAFLLRGVINEAMDRNGDAYDDFARVIDLDKDYLEAYFKLAQLLHKTAEYERAVAAYTLLLNRIDRAGTRAVYIKYDGHNLNQPVVRTLVQMKSDLFAGRADSWRELGEYRMGLKDMKEAIAIELTVDFLVNRALLYADLQYLDSARADLQRAINIDPQSQLAWYNLFVLNPGITIPEDLDKDSDFSPILNLKAIESYEALDYETARKFIREALKLTPNDPTTLLNHARIEMKLGKTISARKSIQQVIEKRPDRIEALYLMGNAYFNERNFKRALEYYESYLKKDPTAAAIWYNTAMSYLELNESVKACQCLQRSADLGMPQAKAMMVAHCRGQ